MTGGRMRRGAISPSTRMSMTRAGEVFDYFGGIGDLRAGILRFVGDPATRIAEDYLRILRYFRFFARYASGPADPAALAAIRAGVPGLAGLSVERVWSELARILSAPDPRAAIGLDGGTGRAGRGAAGRCRSRRGWRAWSRRMPRWIRCCAWQRC